MKILLLLLSGLPLLAARAGDDRLKAATLPAELRAGAHAVIRQQRTVFTVRSAGEAVLEEESVITLLDDKAEKMAVLQVPYDKLSKVNEVEAALYDEAGKLIKRLKKSELEDVSTDDESFASDNRARIARFSRLSYPCTVVFRYSLTTRNLMFYPSWTPLESTDLAVEEASFTVRTPPSLPLRYAEKNLPQPAALGEEGGLKSYTWQVRALKAIDQVEPYSPPFRERLPVVFTAPTSFEVQGYQGYLRNWADMGAFYHALNQDRSYLPDNVKEQARQLVAGESSTVGKVRKLYEHLQATTRYISIQLGIGGWQSMEAAAVARTSYGDCKALTNYMKALLSAVDVPAHEALVRAGDDVDDLLTSFPSYQFNHVILCVPAEKDTIWLECTSQTVPPGYLGAFTGNRHALLVLPGGGRLIRTPGYKAEQNRQVRRASVTIEADGNAQATITTLYSGLQQETRSAVLHQLNTDQQKEWLLKNLDIPASFELKNFRLSQARNTLPTVSETLALAIRQGATRSGNRLFLNPNLMTTLSAPAPLSKPRREALYFDASFEYEDIDTIRYQLPAGYSPEFIPSPVTITTAFGTYEATVTVQQQTLTYVRRMVQRQGRHPAEAYAAWLDFRKKIAKADKTQAVFVKSI